jgi:DNA-binding Xre family transcriptional regulator
MVRIVLDEVLAEKGRTRYWLAKNSGLSHTVIYRYAHGLADGIKLKHMDAMVLALGCSVGDLFAQSSNGGITKKRGRT